MLFFLTQQLISSIQAATPSLGVVFVNEEDKNKFRQDMQRITDQYKNIDMIKPREFIQKVVYQIDDALPKIDIERVIKYIRSKKNIDEIYTPNLSDPEAKYFNDVKQYVNLNPLIDTWVYYYAEPSEYKKSQIYKEENNLKAGSTRKFLSPNVNSRNFTENLQKKLNEELAYQMPFILARVIEKMGTAIMALEKGDTVNLPEENLSKWQLNDQLSTEDKEKAAKLGIFYSLTNVDFKNQKDYVPKLRNALNKSQKTLESFEVKPANFVREIQNILEDAEEGFTKEQVMNVLNIVSADILGDMQHNLIIEKNDKYIKSELLKRSGSKIKLFVEKTQEIKQPAQQQFTQPQRGDAQSGQYQGSREQQSQKPSAPEKPINAQEEAAKRIGGVKEEFNKAKAWLDKILG